MSESGYTIFKPQKQSRPYTAIVMTESGKWYITPPPCHPMITMCEAVELIQFSDGGKKRVAYNWSDLKNRCADAIATDTVQAIDTAIEVCKKNDAEDRRSK